MDVGRRRSVVAGSVWESRMKIDEVRGGIKVFNGEEESSEESMASINNGGDGDITTRLKRGQAGAVATSGKRKTWKSESFDGFDKSPFQISKQKPEPLRNSDEGIKKSPAQARKLRSEGNKEAGVSVEKFERSPIQMRRPRPESLNRVGGESGGGIERNSAQLRKMKSDSVKAIEGTGNGIDQKTPVQLRQAKSELIQTVDDSGEFGICQEKVITDRSVVNYDPKMVVNNDEEDDLDVVDAEDEEDKEEEFEETEIDVKNINFPEPKKIVTEENKVVGEENKVVNEEKKIVNLERRLHQVSRKPVITVEQSPPLVKRRAMYQNLSKPTLRNQEFSKPTPSSYEQTFPETHSKLQSFVDLVMWKEVPRSALVVLIGSFFILSSSYTKDLNLSFISVISYMGLVYLAAIFIYRTLICRGVVYIDDARYVLGEQEAIWLLRLVLPYINELLLKLRALFSGDPATTMKLAVLLFVLARCGSCITIWTVVKLGFMGVFTVPKLCSLYSAQLTSIAKFWVRRFHDMWESCSHKKAVAAAIVFLVLNLSSSVARFWEVFMLYVAFRCYQQSSSVRYDWVEDEARVEETS